MNNEYRWLSDNSVEVMNEKDSVTRRIYDKNNIQDVLLLENKIEMMDSRLEKLDKKIQDNEGVIFLSDKMLKFQPFIILITVVISVLYGFVSGGLLNVADFMTYAIYNGLYNGILGLLWSIIACGFISVYFGIAKLVYNNVVKKQQVEKNISKDLREQYEKELVVAREKQDDLSNSVKKTNEFISLVDYNYEMEQQIDRQINDVCKLSKPKRLSLKKRK